MKLLKKFTKQEKEQYLTISVRIICKVTAGKDRRNYAALVVAKKITQDNFILFGVGKGKAGNYLEAVQKAKNNAIKNLFPLKTIDNNRTITHDTRGKCAATKVLIRQGTPGAGVRAGKIGKMIFEFLNIKDIVCKFFGNTRSCYNTVGALIEALKNLETVNEISKRLGLKTENIIIRKNTHYNMEKTIDISESENFIEKIGFDFDI